MGTKDKGRQDMMKKQKQVETQLAIAKSTAINRSRLEKIKCRRETLAKVAEEAKVALKQQLSNQAASQQFVTKLIVQGLLMLLEDDVQVVCKASDDALVAACINAAAQQYSEVIKKETGASKSVKVTLDRVNKLPPTCM